MVDLSGSITLVFLLLSSSSLAARRPPTKGYSTTIHLVPDDPFLYQAAEKGDLKLCKKVIQDHQDDINMIDNRGHTALHWAATNNHDHVVKWLLEQDGILVDAKDKDHYTPLLIASHKGFYKIVRMLLEAGADQHHQTHHWHLASNAHHFADKHAHMSPHHKHTVRTLVGHHFGVLHLVEDHHEEVTHHYGHQHTDKIRKVEDL
jgi:ankyrin repeat protein